MSVESYIVRIYRRAPHPGKARRARERASPIGIVENAQNGTRRAFHGIEELWSILVKSDTRQ